MELDWFRTQLDISRSIAPGWDVELQLPFDIKKQSVRYLTPEGEEFDNPEGDLHHRDETLEGLGDIKLLFHHRPTDLLFENDSLHLGLGFSAPAGKIQDDPYELGDLGLKHQHIQFGTGTVDPVFRIDYAINPGEWNLGLSFGGQVPLYENRKHFKSPTLLDLSFGVNRNLVEWLGVGVRYVLMYQSRGYWDGKLDHNTGFILQGISVSTPLRISDVVRITLEINLGSDAPPEEMEPWHAAVSAVHDGESPGSQPPSVIQPGLRFYPEKCSRDGDQV